MCRLCDDTDTVDVKSNMAGEMSGIIFGFHESGMVIAYILDMVSQMYWV